MDSRTPLARECQAFFWGLGRHCYEWGGIILIKTSSFREKNVYVWRLFPSSFPKGLMSLNSCCSCLLILCLFVCCCFLVFFSFLLFLLNLFLCLFVCFFNCSPAFYSIYFFVCLFVIYLLSSFLLNLFSLLSPYSLNFFLFSMSSEKKLKHHSFIIESESMHQLNR